MKNFREVTLEDIIHALKKIGGEASWGNILEQVTESRKGDYSYYKDQSNYKTTAFQIVQRHCSYYSKFRGSEKFLRAGNKTFKLLDNSSRINDNNKDIITKFEPLLLKTEKSKKDVTLPDRKGQEFFRTQLVSAYSNRCCITGEKISELLEAAHIQPYIDKRSNHIQNGLLLRVDLHKLFDNWLMYIDENFIINLSPCVKSKYYRNFNGKQISLPNDENCHPSKEALKAREIEFINK